MVTFNDICWFAEEILNQEKTYGPLNETNILEIAVDLGWVEPNGRITNDGVSVLASLKAGRGDVSAAAY